MRLAVAGGGVLGLGVATLAATAGARVTVFEPRAWGDNASGVAAGMLAPALEAALDGEAADYPLLRDAFDAWPAFALGLGLHPLADLHAGALLFAPAEALEQAERRLANLGAPAGRVTERAALALQPALPAGVGEALHVRDDGRIDPLQLLAALKARIKAHGGRIVAQACPPPPVEGFDATVLAAGYETRRWIEVAPQLAALRPIKGHVLHFRGGLDSGAVVRRDGGYAAPQRNGAVYGSTMEPGRDDLSVDPSIVARLHAAASALLPALAATPFVARTGVRASTPDTRPLVGPVAPGLHLAVGARRNGWLLAPLIARAAVRGLLGGETEAIFDPSRF